VRELIALSLLVGLGYGLALAHGDLFFVAVFGGAIAMALSRRYGTYGEDRHKDRNPVGRQHLSDRMS
jgi:hypothetical protein